MNNTTIFIQQSSNFQFLSVCHYIISFGFFFHSQDLLSEDTRKHSVSVLNALFEYLHNSENESKMKFQLLQKALKRSDLYGGGENETLDMKYVNETYQYIISKALFFHYGNINGYLARIINRADNINYSALKEHVLQDLSQNYISVNFCSKETKHLFSETQNVSVEAKQILFATIQNNSVNRNVKLTPLAIEKVFHDYIWPIFPEPDRDMSIIDVNYIYAMVGLKIVRSVTAIIPHFTFHNYILISRQIDLQSFKNKTYEMVLKLFSTPALFFYAYKEKETFREEYRTPVTDEFSIKIYENLFSHINHTMQKIVHEGVLNSLHYKLQNQLEQLQSRTFLARAILKVFCKYENYAQVPSWHVSVYKTAFHWLTKFILPNRCYIEDLPHLEDVYLDQFTDVRKTYTEILKNSIQRVLIDGELLEKMDTNVTVKLARVPNYPMHCMYCPPMSRKVNEDIYLMFAIEEEKQTNFYAFRQEKNALMLIARRDDEEKFARALGVEKSLHMKTAIFANSLKRWNEGSDVFIQRVADEKTKLFVGNLINYHREPTVAEKILNFAKSLIPFYSCIESVKSGDQLGAGFSCTLDVLSFIPILGFSAKYITKLSTSLTIEIGKRYFITNSLAQALRTSSQPIKTVLYQLSKTIVRTVARNILDKSLLKHFAIVSLRSFDPGFELSYQISKFGFQSFRRLFRSLISNFRNAPNLAHFAKLSKRVLNNLRKDSGRVSDHTGLVPRVLDEQNDFQVVRYLYPGGSHFFGPKCVSSFGITGELRSVKGSQFQLPVVPVKSTGDAIRYRPYNPETGQVSDIELEMRKTGILRPIGYYLDLGTVEGNSLKIERNYQVYHHRVYWYRTPTSTNQNPNLNQIAGGNNQRVEVNNLIPENFRHTAGDGQYEFVSPGVREDLGQVANTGNSEFSETGGTRSSGQGSIESAESDNPESFRGKTQTAVSDPPNAVKTDTPKTSEGDVLGQEEPKSAIPQDSNLQITDLDDFPGPSRQTGSNLHQESNSGSQLYDNYVQILKEFKNLGLSSIRKDREAVKNLRIAINDLAIVQMDIDLPSQKPLELWCTKIISRPKIVHFLSHLKDTTFYFNDITLLTNQPAPEFVAKQFSLETEVRYHLTIDSEIGVVDLTYFHEEFENNYVVFNDESFTVTNTFFNERKTVLTIEIKHQPMSKKEWISNREQNLKLLLKKEKTESPRMQSIRKAAEFMTENLPLCNFEKSESMLKSYILKMEPSTSPVPTYDKFAEEMYNNMYILPSYENWLFKNGRYIDDVLFETKLDKIRRLSQAEEKIDHLYRKFYYQRVDEVFNKYKTIPSIRQQIRFEDYYVLYSHWNQELIRSADENRRLAAAIYRVSLRQCGENWIRSPITLYRGRLVPRRTYDKFVQHNKKDLVLFDNFKKFSAKRDVEVAKFFHYREDVSVVKPLLYRIDLRNRAGIADVSRALGNADAINVVNPQVQFILDNVYHETIHGKDVLVVQMHDYQKPTEKRMVDMARDLDRLLSTGTEFYIE